MPRKKVIATRPYNVFLSHATADKWIATVLYEKIEALGAKPFLDSHDIDGGDEIPDSIVDAIWNSQEFVVLLTPHSVSRPWVLLEVGGALMRGADFRITAIMCHVGVDPIPAMLKSKKAVDINDVAEFLSQMGRRVREHHGEE